MSCIIFIAFLHFKEAFSTHTPGYILYSGMEEKKNKQNSDYSQYSISRIYFIFRDLKRNKFHIILVYVFPFQPEWDPGFRQLSRMGLQFQTFIPNGIPTSDGYPSLSHQFHQDFIGIPMGSRFHFLLGISFIKHSIPK